MKRALALCLLLTASACAPLTRDGRLLQAESSRAVARVEAVKPVRVETFQTSAGERLVPVFLLAGPVGLAAAAYAEPDFSTNNGREYQLRFPDGSVRTIAGLAVLEPGDCILVRQNDAGHYLAPVRIEPSRCAF